jgi:uncharacterized protein YhbP (UPF0306 family)
MNKPQQHLEQVAALLREQTTLSLATTREDGEPCVAPLFYFVDEELSLYWLSSQSSQHSRNLLRTPRAAAAVHGSATCWQEIRGVQMRGAVSKITEPKRRAALIKAYCERFQLGTVFRLAIRQSALYLLQPDFFRFIDNARGFSSNVELARPAQGWTLTRPTA